METTKFDALLGRNEIVRKYVDMVMKTVMDTTGLDRKFIEDFMVDYDLTVADLVSLMAWQCPHCKVALQKSGRCPSCRADFSELIWG